MRRDITKNIRLCRVINIKPDVLFSFEKYGQLCISSNRFMSNGKMRLVYDTLIKDRYGLRKIRRRSVSYQLESARKRLLFIYDKDVNYINMNMATQPALYVEEIPVRIILTEKYEGHI